MLKLLDDFTVDEFYDLRERGLKLQEIANIKYVNIGTLSRWIKENNLVGHSRLDRMTVKEFTELKEKGLTNQEIADLKLVHVETVRKWIKANNLNGKSYKFNGYRSKKVNDKHVYELSKSGMKQKDIARYFDCREQTVRNALSRFKKERQA